MWGRIADVDDLPWAWAEERVAAAATYWVTAGGVTLPHPRPLWGIWHGDRLLLSIGSPTLAASLPVDAPVAVHLDSGTEVVIVEGVVADRAVVDADAIAAYDRKYDWSYDVAAYGPLTAVAPRLVHAWRSAGWGGRDGVVAGASFDFR
jgi:hypothetical protein